MTIPRWAMPRLIFPFTPRLVVSGCFERRVRSARMTKRQMPCWIIWNFARWAPERRPPSFVVFYPCRTSVHLPFLRQCNPAHMLGGDGGSSTLSASNTGSSYSRSFRTPSACHACRLYGILYNAGGHLDLVCCKKALLPEHVLTVDTLSVFLLRSSWPETTKLLPTQDPVVVPLRVRLSNL